MGSVAVAIGGGSMPAAAVRRGWGLVSLFRAWAFACHVIIIVFIFPPCSSLSFLLFRPARLTEST